MQLSAREAALRLLNDTENKGLQSGSCVDKLNSGYGFDSKDSSLAVNIYLGCLQYKYKLDHYINAYSDTAPEKIESSVRNIMRIAVYQMIWLDRVPDHAAVDEAVKLCRKYSPRAVSFVNAVLRHISSNKEKLPPVTGDAVERLSVEYSAEKWFAGYLVELFGAEKAEAFLAESNKPASLSLRINTLKIGADEFRKLLAEASITYTDTGFEGIITVGSGNVRELPGFDEGLFFIQDPAAASCTAVAGIKPGQTVLDACSSPGGKSFSAAIAMENEGSILACDINEKKVARVSEGAERLGTSVISCAVADAKKYVPEFDSAFDAVFADVPCSGFGVLRKKPEIKYKSREEIAGLPAIQKCMIDNLCRYVRPGGTLLYSTCTVLREENEDIVEGFLAEHENYRAEDFSCCGINSEKGMYTFLPDVNGTDGFFAAKLIRVY